MGRRKKNTKLYEGKRLKTFNIDDELWKKFHTTVIFFGDGNMTEVIETLMREYVDLHSEGTVEKVKEYWRIGDEKRIKF